LKKRLELGTSQITSIKKEFSEPDRSWLVLQSLETSEGVLFALGSLLLVSFFVRLFGVR
jgi:hypothetical protein